MSLSALVIGSGKGPAPQRDPCLEAASQLLAAIHAHDAEGVDMALKAHKAAVDAYSKKSEDDEDGDEGY